MTPQRVAEKLIRRRRPTVLRDACTLMASDLGSPAGITLNAGLGSSWWTGAVVLLPVPAAVSRT